LRREWCDRLPRTLGGDRERSTPWSRRRLVLLWEAGSGSQAQLIGLLADERSESSVKKAPFLYQTKRAHGDSRRLRSVRSVCDPASQGEIGLCSGQSRRDRSMIRPVKARLVCGAASQGNCIKCSNCAPFTV